MRSPNLGGGGLGRIVGLLNCVLPKRTVRGFVLTLMTLLVIGRTADEPGQTVQQGALPTHLWHVPGIAKWVPKTCMTMWEPSSSSFCMLSDDSTD